MVAGPSGVQVDGVNFITSQALASIFRAAASNQENSIVFASQISHMRASTKEAATKIAGQGVVPIANGVSIQGTSLTGTIPVVIAGTTISAGDSTLYLEGKSYPLPTGNPAPLTTLANGAVALPF